MLFIKNLYLLLLVGIVSPLLAENPIDIIPVNSSKFNEHARLQITSPTILKKNSPILLLVSNFPIGVDLKSNSLEELGVPLNKMGSRVLLVFNNGSRLYVTKVDANLLLTQRSYFNKRFRVKVPGKIYDSIEATSFIIYSMLVNGYGETIKTRNAFYTDVYSYQKKRKTFVPLESGVKKPLVVYNEPYGTVGKGNILLDFYVRNCNISKDEYKVDVYIDGKKITRIVSWKPHVIRNLPPGEHEIKLTLINSTGKVENNYASVEKSTIYVK